MRRVGVMPCVTLLLLALPAAAIAKPPPPPSPVVVSGDNDGVVQTVVTAPGSGGQSTDVSVVSSSNRSQCTWQVVYTVQPVQRMPRPPLQPGTWYGEFCSDATWMSALVFVPDGSNNAPVVDSPATLAQQAVNQLPLPQPGAEHNPSGDALVNLSTWWWIDPQQWHRLTQRTAVGPVWARVTARPVRSVWDAGDGTAPLSCRGGGTPYNTNEEADAQATDCSHTYTESSAGQPQSGPDPNDRFFTVTVTVYWQVTFVGAGGARGALPVMTRTTRFPLRVDERQTVVTGGSG